MLSLSVQICNYLKPLGVTAKQVLQRYLHNLIVDHRISLFVAGRCNVRSFISKSSRFEILKIQNFIQDSKFKSKQRAGAGAAVRARDEPDAPG